ncbi:hypothetical protein B296_00027953 [Ensete ventricosum]|uniref:Uncharacterized protein n=1 Tax=Ensete ventricosum TaxID=4639 RepID=A0A426XU27_ENSVE|nr:hypothetical protein B296_00027953 [Ensete ventricosum]
MGATGASNERRKGEQGSGLVGGEEEATTGGRGEDSDDRQEEAAGALMFGAAKADDSSKEARGRQGSSASLNLQAAHFKEAPPGALARAQASGASGERPAFVVAAATAAALRRRRCSLVPLLSVSSFRSRSGGCIGGIGDGVNRVVLLGGAKGAGRTEIDGLPAEEERTDVVCSTRFRTN